MSRLLICFFLMIVSIIGTSAAPAAKSLKLRVIFFEPSSDDPTELYVPNDGKGAFLQVKPGSSIGSDKISCPLSSSGKITFSKSRNATDVIAVAEIPPEVMEANLFFVKREKPDAGQPLYDVVVVDNSRAAIPDGGLAAANATDSPLKVTVGTESGEVAPGKHFIARRPDDRDEYNMAPFNVSIKQGADWKTLKNNTMRYAEAERYFVIIHSPSKTSRPTVRIYKQVKP